VAIAHRDRPLPPLPARLPAEVVTFVMMLTAKDPAWRPPSASQVACHARRLRDQVVSGTTGAQSVPAGPPLAATGPPGSRARAAAAAGMRTGWSRRRRALGAVSAVLAAFTCLVVLTVTGLASAPRPAVGPLSGAQQAAQPAVKSPSTASPVAAEPGGQQPGGASTTIIGAVAAITHRSAGNPVSQPGPRHKNPSAPGKPAKPRPGKRTGHGKPPGAGGPQPAATVGS